MVDKLIIGSSTTLQIPSSTTSPVTTKCSLSNNNTKLVFLKEECYACVLLCFFLYIYSQMLCCYTISAFAKTTMVRLVLLHQTKFNTQYGNLSAVMTDISTITVSEAQC